MQAKEKKFVPVRHLSPSHPEYTSHCPAKTEKGSRCASRLREGNIPLIKELLAKLQDGHKDSIDDETRKETLRRIAVLSICGRQKNYIDTAVLQWLAENGPQASHSMGPQTPPVPLRPTKGGNAMLADTERGSKLKFIPYRREETETLVADEQSRELNRILDENIGTKFLKHLRDSTAERGYLYIFECEGETGMYKVGRTKRFMERDAEQQKCYRVAQYQSICCPNAELFERIIQLEFAQYRYQHYCDRCNRFHTEWFKAPFNDIVEHIRLWSQFSQDLQRGDTFAKLSQVSVQLPGTSSDPDRWYKWGLGYVRKWSRSQDPQLNPSGESVVSKATGTKDLEPDDNTVSVPELSPCSSSPGTPGDDFADPPTPTPSSRTRNEKFSSQGALTIPDTTSPEQDDVFWTPVEDLSKMPSTWTPPSSVHIAGLTMELPIRQKGPRKLAPHESAEAADETIFL
ncbi:T5orf172 domain-containing protein [Aspergillus desertorum]